ncbi:MAG: class I tRNA ligase family protein, partial [Saprospiraceae bacterium]
MKLDFEHIESKWKKIWAETHLYKVNEDTTRPKYYVLDMFPYPSGAGLHVGHPLGYVGSDIYTRYKRMKGFNVLHPMGYDAFGLPAEQYALDTGVHPSKSTSDNIIRYRSQLDNIGLSFDWSRQVRTDDPHYYRWTQWIFLQIFQHYYDKTDDKAYPISRLIEIFKSKGSEGINAASSSHDPFTSDQWSAMTPAEQSLMLMNYRLAYRKTGYVNWCEALGTVLANDEVKDGLSERGGYPVVQKEMLQWSLRITAYAERLLKGMESLQWSESMKTVQRNWIGRSEGAFIHFQIADQKDVSIKVFTTRPDTIFGSAFIVLAPDHDLVPSLTAANLFDNVKSFKERVKSKSADQRTTSQKIPDGMWLGSYALHPITGDEIQIWIADYVLKDYGTGAIMAVPGDDARDKAFALYNQLPVIEVIDRSQVQGADIGDREGMMMNSSFLDGLNVEAAIASMLDYLEKNNLGVRNIEYKLRDANFSRQRYWGEPFPIYYDEAGIVHAMDENTLPLELPDLDDFKPSPDGRSPLARLTEWTQPYPGMKRETDTMPGYAGSSWYFLRYMDPSNDKTFASKESIEYWQDVDLYIGGVEHAVGHLMYSRFWHKFLYDLGKVPTQEPFKKLVNQGMIQGIVESLFIFKEKKDGKAHFISADLVTERKILREQLSSIPVHIDFVTDYGHPDSYLDEKGIASFIKWRPEYSNAFFETKNGIQQFAYLQNVELRTLSEIGKMSKRYHNVVNPDDVIARYGADCFRMYEMFLGPIEQSKPWDTMGIEGVSKFLKKLWSLFFNDKDELIVNTNSPSEDAQKAIHATIKKINEDVERFSFNTSISQFMICVNELRKLDEHSAEILDPLVRTMAPFAPFLTEELWSLLGHHTSVHLAPFPEYDEKWLVTTSITYPVCVNGKKRGEINLPVGSTNAEIEKAATVENRKEYKVVKTVVEKSAKNKKTIEQSKPKTVIPKV